MPSSAHMIVQKTLHFSAILYYLTVDASIVVGMEKAHERLGRPKDDPFVNRMLNGSVTYFTAWNLIIHQVYFSLCCVEYLWDYFPKALSLRSQEQLRIVRRMMLPIILFPSSCEVVFNFWTIYSYAPRLVFGDFLDIINPAWINHAIHTFILPIVVLEMYLRAQSEGIWDGGFYRDVSKLNALFTAYLVTVLVEYHRKGTWPYPFMDSMDGKMFAGLVALCFVMGWTWFSLGRCLSKRLCEKATTVRTDPVDSSLKAK